VYLSGYSNFPAMDKLEKGPKEIFSPEIQKVSRMSVSWNVRKSMTSEFVLFAGFVAFGRARRIGEFQIRRTVHKTQPINRRRDAKQRYVSDNFK